jgi:transcriptional regulator with XRE-family HTH domain
MAASLRAPEYDFLRKLLTEAREKSQLTQADISRRLGRPQSFVAKYEGGERRLDVIEFIKICAALNIDPARTIAATAKRRLSK